MTLASRLGCATPGVTLAGINGPNVEWEAAINAQDLVEIAQTADRLGFDHITCSEHVGIPSAFEESRGARYYDPLSTFGFLAAKTERVRFATHVLVLAYSHPLQIAKRYGTLDRLSGGRVILGVGVGSLHEEFDLLGLGGAPFEQRGERGDDAIRAIKASFGRRWPEYSGPHYAFSDFVIDPCGVQEKVPIWIGGRSRRSLRRAVELGDGWMPFGLTVAEMGAMIAAAKQTDAWGARETDLDCVLMHDGRIDPSGAPGEAADAIGAVFAVGGTIATVRCHGKSLAHYLEQLEALAELRI